MRSLFTNGFSGFALLTASGPPSAAGLRHSLSSSLKPFAYFEKHFLALKKNQEIFTYSLMRLKTFFPDLIQAPSVVLSAQACKHEPLTKRALAQTETKTSSLDSVSVQSPHNF